MATPQATPRDSIRKDPIGMSTHIEIKSQTESWVDESLQCYPLLRDKTPLELEQLNKQVLKILDWHFLPTVTLMLLMAYLDRINVANARLAGMQDDLDMSDETWSAGISLFYVGYIITQLPASIMLAKGKACYQLPLYMLAWSIVTAAMAAMKTEWSFLVCRLFVGMTEGLFLPAISLMSSSVSETCSCRILTFKSKSGLVTSRFDSGTRRKKLPSAWQFGMPGTLHPTSSPGF
jgi:hypothetical protein